MGTVIGRNVSRSPASFSSFNIQAITGPRLSQKVTGPNDDVTIAAGEEYTIDQDVEMGVLNVMGKLRCPAGGQYTIKAAGIMVMGTGSIFECGNETQRFEGRLVIKLKGGRSLGAADGERAFSVMGNGILKLYGRNKNFGFQKISRNVEAGDKVVYLSSPVNWNAGEKLILGPTGFNPLEAETRIIESVAADGLAVVVTTPFAYKHTGVTKNYAAQGKNWLLDERAEVAVLDRNIVVTAEGDEATLDNEKFGGHIMVMASAKAYVDGVELSRLGQLGKMGRYPFHWHLAGDVPGQFIRNSSIHDSYQRCVTIHGTNGATVENNVCFNHFGHGYFLENGNEVNNVIAGNLGMLTRRVPAGKGLLASDMGPIKNPRFSGPSTFWITNPANIVRNNVASGAEGSGFWMSFSDRLRCPAGASCEFAADPAQANVFPSRTATLEYSGNVAHSAEVGHTWDGTEDGALINNPLNPRARDVVAVHYHPPTTPVFPGLTAFKNTGAGYYFRGEHALYTNLIGADNAMTLFFAYNQTVHDSLIVGKSQFFEDREIPYLVSMDPWLPRQITGALLYDGPFELQRVHFADFGTAPLRYADYDLMPIPFVSGGGADRFENAVKSLTFEPNPARRIYFEWPDAWLDTPWTTGLRDMDGSLTGRANWTIVPNHAMNRDPSCVDFQGALLCPYNLGRLFLLASSWPAPYDGNTMPFVVSRTDGAKGDHHKNSGLWYNNKTNLILGGAYEYKLDFDGVKPNSLGFNFATRTVGESSPVVELANMGFQCNVAGATRVASLDQLRAAGSNAYFYDERRLFIRIFASGRNPANLSEFAIRGNAPGISVQCAQRSTLLDSSVFDEATYRARNPDLVSLSSVDLRNHWVSNGIYEGRDAHPDFSASTYLARYADLRTAFGTNLAAAAEHFVANGRIESRIGFANDVRGHIDQVTAEGLVSGWACARGIDQPIGVHLYAGGPSGTGSLVATGFANQASEPGVAAACNSNGTQHRFAFQLNDQQLRQFSGRSVVVHGISPVGRANDVIGRSGEMSLPIRAPSDIVGVIDQVSASGLISGWACARGINQSVPVHVYVGGGAGGGGTIFAVVNADQASEPGVAQNCEAGGTNYRFSLQASADQIAAHGSKTVYVYGISPVGRDNLSLTNSGQFTLPAPPPPPPVPDLTGYIDQVTGDGVISGWACARGLNQSVSVHIYAGGPAGTGAYVTAANADIASDPAVAAACQASGAAYRFSVQLDPGQRHVFAGRSIFVHGISPVGRDNLLIARSGEMSLPLAASDAVYRFYNGATGEHFMTMSYDEGVGAGYGYEGSTFRLFKHAGTWGTYAIYRCYGSGMHMMSSDPNCEGLTPEGVMGYAYSRQVSGTRPLYRFRHPATGDHLSTVDHNEGVGAGYTYEGIIGYVQ